MLLVLLVLTPTVALAQVAVFLEGRINSIVDNGDGSGAITVMGVTVNIPAGVPITTATATLTMAQLADPTPMPGRSEPGFVGGTGLIDGTSLNGVVTATNAAIW